MTAATDHAFVRPLSGTTLSPYDLMEIGTKLMNALAQTEVLGHSAPGDTLEYTDGEHLIRDVIAWTSGRQRFAPGCEERVRQFVQDSGWPRYAGECGAAAADPTPKSQTPAVVMPGSLRKEYR